MGQRPTEACHLDGNVFSQMARPSHRSEGYGLTTASLLFFHLLRFFDVFPCWSFKFVSDNLGLIRRINQLIYHSEHFPNITLQPDWDLIREIQMSIRALDRPSTFYHVKVHPDDHQAYNELSLETRLNVDADFLAGRFRRNDPSMISLVPRITSNPSLEVFAKQLGALLHSFLSFPLSNGTTHGPLTSVI
jgi:hypothetical protein